MYGLGATNGMEFPLFGSGKGIKVNGLMNHPSLENWIMKRASKNITVDKNARIIRWEGVIPGNISKLIRDNCETLEFSVEIGRKTLVVFKGLTFEVHRKRGNRRMLLQNSLSSC